jgi:hypothetical protein
MEKSSYFQNNGSNAGVLPSGYLQTATSAGQNIGNALNDIGSTINDAMTRHVANEQQRTVNMGVLNGYLGNAQNLDPNLVQSIDPKLIKKYQGGALTLEDSKALLGTIASNQAMQQFKTQQSAAAQEAAIRSNQISLGATAAQFAPTEAQQRINTGNQNLALGGQQLTAAQNQNKTAAATSAANVAANQAGQENVDPTKRLANWVNTVIANGGQVSTQDLEAKKAELGVPRNVKIDVQSVFDEQGNYVGKSLKYNGVPSDFIANPFNNPAIMEKTIKIGNENLVAPTTGEATQFRNALNTQKNLVQQSQQISDLIQQNGSKVGTWGTESRAKMQSLMAQFRNNVITTFPSTRMSQEVENISKQMTGTPEDFFSNNANALAKINNVVNTHAEELANAASTYSNGASRINKSTFGWKQYGQANSKAPASSSVRQFDTTGKEIINNQ